MSTNISNTDNIIHMSDVTDRVEELWDELTQRHEDGQFMSTFDDWIKNSRDNSDPIYAAFGKDGMEVQEAIEEFYKLNALLDEVRGNGRNHQWEGNWYPHSLIHADYFEDAMDELLEDIGDMPQNIPSYLTITVNYEALQQDYTSVEYDGVTYWYR